MPRSKLPQSGFLYLPLGGSGQFGLHCTLYGWNGQYIMVDCGMGFAAKTTPGVDVLAPDISLIAAEKDRLLGIILTHGHIDHIGSLGHVWPYLKKPIYATKLTKRLTEKVMGEFVASRDAPVMLCHHDTPVQIGPFEITFHEAAHSIPEGNMLRVSCEGGSVIHATDWKLDNDPLIGKESDLELLKRWAADPKCRAWVGDSTNALDKGRTESESSLPETFERLFVEKSGCIFVTTLSSNLTRIRSLALAARQAGRTPVMAGHALRKMVSAARETGLFDDVPEFVDARDFPGLKRDKCVVVCSGSQGERFAALRRIAFDAHPYLNAKRGDTVIFSARVIPGNEYEIHRIQNTFLANDIEVIRPSDDSVYVSSHAKEDELVEMYTAARPSCVIPCHGEEAHLRRHIEIAENCGVPHPLLVRNGDMVQLDADPAPQIIGHTEIGVYGIDGSRMISLIGSRSIRERYKLQDAGHLLIVVSETGVKLTLRGLFEDAERSEALPALEEIVRISLKEIGPRTSAEQEIRRRIKAYCNHRAGKAPVIDVVLPWA